MNIMTLYHQTKRRAHRRLLAMGRALLGLTLLAGTLAGCGDMLQADNSTDGVNSRPALPPITT